MSRKKPDPLSAPKLPAPIEREPWTPWGKWAKRRRDRKEQKRLEKEERRRQKQRERELRSLRRRRLAARQMVFIGLIGLACIIAFLVMLLLGHPYPWESLGDVTTVMQASQRLEWGAARWQELAVRRYRIEVEYISGEATCGPALLEVNEAKARLLPGQTGANWRRADCDPLIDQLTIDGALAWLEQTRQAFQPGVTYFSASVDPTFGYPTAAHAGVYDPARGAPGCCWIVNWRNFQPLDE